MTKALPADVLQADDVTLEGILTGGLKLRLWSEEEIEKYKFRQMCWHPFSLVDYFWGGTKHSDIIRLWIGVAYVVTVGGLLFTLSVLSGINHLGIGWLPVFYGIGCILISLLASAHYGASTNIWGFVWKRTEVTSGGWYYYAHQGSRGDRQLPDFALDLMNRIKEVVPFSIFYIHTFGKDPILEVRSEILDGVAMVLVWDESGVVEPPKR